MFWLHLCVLFKIPTVAEAQERIDFEQFCEWIAYFRIEDPEWRADLRAGIIASVVANSNLTKEDKHKAAKPSDFMPLAPKPLKSAYRKSETQTELETETDPDEEHKSGPEQWEKFFQAKVEMQKKIDDRFDISVR